MNPKTARAILKDGGIKTLIEAAEPTSYPDDDFDLKYLAKIQEAYRELERHLKTIAKKK